MLGEVEGGVSSFTIEKMAAAYSSKFLHLPDAHHHAAKSDLGMILVGFLNYFGEESDIGTNRIRLLLVCLKPISKKLQSAISGLVLELQTLLWRAIFPSRKAKESHKYWVLRGAHCACSDSVMMVKTTRQKKVCNALSVHVYADTRILEKGDQL